MVQKRSAHWRAVVASAGNRTRGWPTLSEDDLLMATANFTTKPPMLLNEAVSNVCGCVVCNHEEVDRREKAGGGEDLGWRKTAVVRPRRAQSHLAQ